jgi:hypothetical protein
MQVEPREVGLTEVGPTEKGLLVVEKDREDFDSREIVPPKVGSSEVGSSEVESSEVGFDQSSESGSSGTIPSRRSLQCRDMFCVRHRRPSDQSSLGTSARNAPSPSNLPNHVYNQWFTVVSRPLKLRNFLRVALGEPNP